MTLDLPPGVFFEPSRQRYRVRLYRQEVVVWRTYHKTLDEALEALSLARQAQDDWPAPAEHRAESYRVPQQLTDLFL